MHPTLAATTPINQYHPLLHRHAPVVRYLLQQGADPFVQDKPRGYYCLHIAAYHGHVDVLHVLLDPATRVERNGRRIPLSAAKVQYTGGTCRFIDSRAALGMTAMHLAAIKGKAGVAAVLLQRGASMAVRTVGQDALDGVPITLGATPLHLAAKCGSMDTLQAMLQVRWTLMLLLLTMTTTTGTMMGVVEYMCECVHAPQTLPMSRPMWMAWAPLHGSTATVASTCVGCATARARCPTTPPPALATAKPRSCSTPGLHWS